MEERSTFNAVADLYGRARPGYPDTLVRDVVAFAALGPGDDILEVGCGAGQATASFSGRGYRITALDPGDALLRVARERLAGVTDVRFVHATFEAWDVGPARFKLVFAAQSWHWIPPELGFAKAADLLARDGTLAVFGHVPGALPDPLLSAFRDLYLRHVGAWGPPGEVGYLPTGPFKGWFDDSARFGDVLHKRYKWNWKHSAASYVAFARTRSDHQVMPPEMRDGLLKDLESAIERHGDAFDWPYETHLYMAHRRA